MDLDFDKELIETRKIDEHLKLQVFKTIDNRHMIYKYIYKDGKFVCEKRFLNSVAESDQCKQFTQSMQTSEDFLKYMGVL